MAEKPAAKKEGQPTKRVVLMEFDAKAKGILNSLPEEAREALLGQLGKENVEAMEGEMFTVLIPVAEANGGPKAIIDETAKVRGRFRAIARDSYDQGHEAIPPERQQFELKPL